MKKILVILLVFLSLTAFSIAEAKTKLEMWPAINESPQNFTSSAYADYLSLSFTPGAGGATSYIILGQVGTAIFSAGTIGKVQMTVKGATTREFADGIVIGCIAVTDI